MTNRRRLGPEGSAAGNATRAATGGPTPAPTGDAAAPASYRALFNVPFLGRALLGMQAARIAQSMTGLALVLFSLDRYHSPEIAGIVTFAGIAPGLVVSPIAGALLDRHGRTRLITLDFVIGAASLVLIGLLALADALPAWLLVLIAALSALTGPLSNVGLRSLFPLMAPRHLWERLNAVDSNGYVVAQIIGPPVAAILVSVAGGAWAVIAIGLSYGIAAAIVAGVADPETQTSSTGSLLRDAWDGLVYTFRNPTLRGLGFSITTLNLAGGISTIVIPLIVLQRLGLDQAAVGIVYAVQGVFGLVAGFVAGRMETHGRERNLIVVPMFLWAGATALLYPAAGLPLVIVAMAAMGLINGPMDVAMFTVRQRRTDPAWIGRAFAVSMSFNFAGFPIGSVIGGLLAAQSLELAIGVAVVACVGSGIIAAAMIPARGPEVA